ncbi:MAG TPA: META domain-containing protein [Psychromonas sp.]
MKFFKQLSLLLISLTFFACSIKTAEHMESKNSAFALIQKKWQLESIDGIPVSAETDSSLTVDAQGQATGKLACNNFFGRLALKDNTLKIDAMGSTRMLCPGEMNQVERILSSVLNDWSDIHLTDNRLSLSGKKHRLSYYAER